MKQIGILVVAIALLAGGAFAWKSGLLNKIPALSQLKPPEVLGTQDAKTAALEADKQIADMIRQASNGEWQGFQLPNLSQATISAQVSMTPESALKTIKEQGAQAFLGETLQQAQVTVNGVSGQVVERARYEYCKGVVDSYESGEPAR